MFLQVPVFAEAALCESLSKGEYALESEPRTDVLLVTGLHQVRFFLLGNTPPASQVHKQGQCIVFYRAAGFRVFNSCKAQF